MSKPIDVYASEAEEMTAHLTANRVPLVALYQALAKDLGITLKTNIGDLIDDQAAIATAVAARAKAAQTAATTATQDAADTSGEKATAAEKAHYLVASARTLVRTTFGNPVANRVFGKGRTPDGALPLELYMTAAITQLKDTTATWIKKNELAQVDPLALATSLEASLKALIADKGEHTEARADATVSVTNRQKVAEQTREARNGLRRIVEGILLLGGDSEGAARVAVHHHESKTVGQADTPPVSSAASAGATK